MAVNRHLPKNSPLNSAMGLASGSAWKTTVGIAIALATALFAGSQLIGTAMTQPETNFENRRRDDALQDGLQKLAEAQHRAQLDALVRENQALGNKLLELNTELQQQRETQRLSDAAEKFSRDLSAATRIALEGQARRPEPDDRPRGSRAAKSRVSAKPARKSATSTPESISPPTPRVSVHEIRRFKYEYRVTVGTDPAESDRAYYRQRFSMGCNIPPSAIRDTPGGFIIASDGCEPSTFNGFEIVQIGGVGLAPATAIR